MEKTAKTEVMPMGKLIVYTLGNFSVGILNTVAGLLTYFYIPPETGETSFPQLISREAIFGITIIGLCGLLSEWIGIFVDPSMAAISDRTVSKIGRRKLYLLIGALPFALFTYMLFHSPVNGVSSVNAIWVIVVMIFFGLFRGVYGIPYGALIPELGSTSKVRMFISTFHSVSWALGFVLGGTLIFTFKDILQSSYGMAPVTAFRLIVAVFAVLGFIFALLPVLVIDEKRYCSGHVSKEPPVKAMIEAFKNKDFMKILLSMTIYFMADRIMMLGLVYYVTLLLRLEEAMVGTLGAVMFVMSFLWYWPLNKAAEKVSKKKLAIGGFVLQTLVMLMLGIAGLIPVNPNLWVWTIIVIMSFMAAITGIVPGAIIAEVIRADGVRTGIYKEATYGAAMSIFMKIPMSVISFLFPAMILLGRSVDNPMGVRLTAYMAVIIMIIAIVIFCTYNEKETLEVLAQDKEK